MRKASCCLLGVLVVVLASSCGAKEETPAASGPAPAKEAPAPATAENDTTAQAAASTVSSATAIPTFTDAAPPVPEVAPLSKPAAGSAAKGASLYAAKCASCHGADAKGDTTIGRNNGVLDFRSPRVQALSGMELRKIMDAGTGRVSKAAHPDAKMSDADIRDMIAFIHSLKP